MQSKLAALTLLRLEKPSGKEKHYNIQTDSNITLTERLHSMILQNIFLILLQVDTAFLLELRKMSLESKELPKNMKTYCMKDTGGKKIPGKFGS